MTTTPQSEAWAGDFGTEYTHRNLESGPSWESLRTFWQKALRMVEGWPTCELSLRHILEIGAGTGANLTAMAPYTRGAIRQAYEINPEAVKVLRANPDVSGVKEADFLEGIHLKCYGLVFTRGVLIHVHPKKLELAYERIYHASRRYILLAEYYSRQPQEISYRGHRELCWKRDFAGEMMSYYPDLKLLDYGFQYHLDPKHPQDDITWFLMEKQN